MILKIIKCNIENCTQEHREAAPGEGFPGWGMIQGRQDEKGNTDFHLCPKHLKEIFEYIRNKSDGLD